jgi:hypothetical protein
MSAETIRAFGLYIVMPICFFGLLGYMIYLSEKDNE